jgi:hypothetical protein
MLNTLMAQAGRHDHEQQRDHPPRDRARVKTALDGRSLASSVHRRIVTGS